ncbi:nuclease-related domain-containing protein [Chryseomicrobium sp. FSL W7-1435]|uniref:nuclease-related domain-containing protein n=1 Tax=Chryseomicrobium sp. FSL W7-1435 TaxID=2921704 RepID=UPI00315A3814
MKQAGESGEKDVASYLQEALHQLPAYVLHNYHVKIPNTFSIQIDYLIFTSQFILILEVKNIKGHIFFNQNPAQLIRTLDGEVMAMDCPFAQMDRNVLHFKRLLSKSELPIYTVIVWTNRSAVLEAAPSNSPHKILFLKQLPYYISQLLKLPEQEVHLGSLVKNLKAKATPFYQPDLCQRYGIAPSELVRGLLCLTCYSPMNLHVRTWVCPKCRVKNNHMVNENILGLFDLLGDTLQMNDLKQILPTLYSRLLGNLVKSGEVRSTAYRKNRTYTLHRPSKVKWLEVKLDHR